MSYLLGIDIGTTNIKVILFDVELNQILDIESITYEINTPSKSYAEYNPSKWYNHVCKCINKLLLNNNIESKLINGIGVSGQMHGLVALDKDKKILMPAILHCDTRTEKQVEQIKKQVGKDIIRDELMNPIYTGFLIPSLCWIRDEKKDIFSKIKYLMLPKDYINYRLTGEICTDYSDASGTLGLDVQRGRWSSNVLERLDLDKDVFPELRNSYDIIGKITEKASIETGLKVGTPVVCGGGDAIMQAIGNGLINDKYGIINIGTSGQIMFSIDSPIKNKFLNTNTFISYEKNKWLAVAAIMSAGASYKWISRLFEERNYDILNSYVEQIPIGSNDLIFLPHLNGERTPYLNSSLRGSLIGITQETNKFHITRAVMEGVSFALKECFDVLLDMGLDSNKFIISGGASKGSVWIQMLADIFNRPISISNMSEQAATGAAICAGIGSGCYKDMQDAVNSIVKIDEYEYTPNKEANYEYMKYYRLYKKFHYENIYDNDFPL